MIVLLGYMGSGKTSVGQCVSRLLNLEFIDLDKYIESNEGNSISDIFKEKGAIYFRKKEHEYFKKILKSSKKIVLSLGGGTPCYYNHMELLNVDESIRSFYLDGSIDELTNRLWKQKGTRPLLNEIKSKDELMEFIGKHLFERRPYYQQADYKIVVQEKTIEELSKEIISYLF